MVVLPTEPGSRPSRGLFTLGRGRKAENPFHPTTTRTFFASPEWIAIAALCKDAIGLAPPR